MLTLTLALAARAGMLTQGLAGRPRNAGARRELAGHETRALGRDLPGTALG